MIERTINKVLKSISNLSAEYKIALIRILTGIVENIIALDKDKVDKEEGKGLSTNDFTNELKTKLNNTEFYPDSAVWDAQNKNIIFKHQGIVLPNMTISGANFIKDGMVDNVQIQNNNLIITFNTDAGKQPILVPLTDIFNFNFITPITYSELKSLRDSNKLFPGMQYRITDYQCTVNSTIDYARSANNQFDIIVTADTINKLNEDARACRHEGDIYFANSKLEAWKLKYSLDNDTNRFEWADTENGKGVIYWMKDERYNECSYDFKNIQFKRYAITDIINTYPKTPTLILNKLNTLKYSQSRKHYSYQSSNIIYTYYDNNVSYTITLVVDSNNFNWYYTFNEQLNYNNNNIILNNSSILKIQLLNIVIIDVAKNNYIYIEGKGNTTFSNCVDNTIYSLNECILNLNNCKILNNFYNNICFENLSSTYYTLSNSIICNSTIGIDIKNCSSLFLGNMINNIKLRNSSYIIIMYSCNNIIINNSNQININGYNNNITINNSERITFEKVYMYNIIIEHNININITSTQTTSYSNKIQNIKINGGTNVTTTPKTISHDTINDDFQTIYKNANSREVTIE